LDFMRDCKIIPNPALRFGLTAPVIDSALGLVVEDHRRRQFGSWGAIAAMDDLRIAASDDPVSVRFLAQRLPAAQPVVFSDFVEIEALLTERPLAFDALLMSAEEGAAWTIRHPRFNLVTPAPVLVVPFGYAVARGDTQTLELFDAWLRTAQGHRTIAALCRYWMLGDIAATRSPRWSVARDLLGWFQ
jgi:hypothetical protein